MYISDNNSTKFNIIKKNSEKLCFDEFKVRILEYFFVKKNIFEVIGQMGTLQDILNGKVTKSSDYFISDLVKNTPNYKIKCLRPTLSNSTLIDEIRSELITSDKNIFLAFLQDVLDHNDLTDKDPFVDFINSCVDGLDLVYELDFQILKLNGKYEIRYKQLKGKKIRQLSVRKNLEKDNNLELILESYEKLCEIRLSPKLIPKTKLDKTDALDKIVTIIDNLLSEVYKVKIASRENLLELLTKDSKTDFAQKVFKPFLDYLISDAHHNIKLNTSVFNDLNTQQFNIAFDLLMLIFENLALVNPKS